MKQHPPATSSYFFNRPLPAGLEGLHDLALDLRWTWSHFSDRLWERLDPEAWERTRNPYFILQSVAQNRLEDVAQNENFRAHLQTWLNQRREYLQDPDWFQIELFANSPKSGEPFCIIMTKEKAMPVMVNAFFYQATIPKSPTPNHYTARLLRPSDPKAKIPGEIQYIPWQR